MRRPVRSWLIRAVSVAMVCCLAATLSPGKVDAIPAKPKPVAVLSGDPWDNGTGRDATQKRSTDVALSDANDVSIEQVTMYLRLAELLSVLRLVVR